MIFDIQIQLIQTTLSILKCTPILISVVLLFFLFSLLSSQSKLYFQTHILQTQKASGDVAEPLRSMRKVKGSSVLEQACSIIISLWREGFNPKEFDDDRFITFCCVKNRMGRLFEVDCGWEGVCGEVSELSDTEEQELEEIRKQKMREKKIAEL